jgi:proline iminopeptidase
MRFIFILFILLPLSSFASEEEGYINVEGGKIWYKLIKAEIDQNLSPLIIIPGGPGASHNYLTDLLPLSINRDVIFYDQYACGKSIKASNNKYYSFKKNISDLRKLVKYLGIKRYILFGHSYGGAVATKYSLDNQNEITGLILASPLLNAKIWIEDTKALIELMDKRHSSILLSTKTNSNNHLEATNLFYKKHLCRDEPWPENLKNSMDNLNMEIYEFMWGRTQFLPNFELNNTSLKEQSLYPNIAKENSDSLPQNENSITGSLKDLDLLEELPELNVPVLLTGGKFDMMRPETARKIILPNLTKGTYVEFPKSSHNPHLEENIYYLIILEKFMKEMDKDQSNRDAILPDPYHNPLIFEQ